MNGLRCFFAGAAIVVASNLFGQVVGCSSMPDPKDPTSAIAKCKEEARAKHDAGASVDESMDAYDACMKREGL